MSPEPDEFRGVSLSPNGGATITEAYEAVTKELVRTRQENETLQDALYEAIRALDEVGF